MAYLVVFCRLLVAGIFAVSVIAKLRDLRSFQQALRGYHLVPPRAELSVAAVVIAAEALTVGLLSVSATAAIGFLLAGGVLAGFSVAMGSVRRRGLVTQCGCLGRRSATVSAAHIWRNLVLIGICALAVLAAFTGSRLVEPSSVVLLCLVAACGVATFVFFDDLIALSRPPERNQS